MSFVRAVLASVWVGWHREFSWTNPIAGLSVKTIAPFASVMTVSAIYWFGSTQGRLVNPESLAFILIGAALYAHIAAYSWVPTLAVAEGKWSNVFQVVSVSPGSSPPYLAGRCLAAFVTSTITSMVSLVLAYSVSSLLYNMAIPIIISPVSGLLLTLALVVNILASMGLGFLLSAYAVFATKFEWALPTYVAGLLMVFSGALFPVTVLPFPLSSLADVLPFTHFIRAARDALIYGDVQSYFGDVGLSFVGGLLFLGVGLLAYTRAERRARRLGVLDRKVV